MTMNLFAKRLLYPVFTLLVAVLLWQGCKKDDGGQDGPPCNISGVSFSYTANIKGIIDRNCLSCHGGLGPGPHDYSTYEGIKSVLDNGLVLERVVIKKDMPEGGGMSQAERDSINCWILSGYPK
ncbi:MAG: cytochrome c [Lewinellaceae bacterium]|nr:cytochrome c [Saprospiraceae bacterium]MCB9353495.1 cytochrome c [Lewinellaceae bacterium]